MWLIIKWVKWVLCFCAVLVCRYQSNSIWMFYQFSCLYMADMIDCLRHCQIYIYTVSGIISDRNTGAFDCIFPNFCCFLSSCCFTLSLWHTWQILNSAVVMRLDFVNYNFLYEIVKCYLFLCFCQQWKWFVLSANISFHGSSLVANVKIKT